jgi:predicted phosphodiesterase
MSRAIILSDGHLGEASDTHTQREAKTQAMKNIAGYIQAVRAQTIILNGDGFHHMDGKFENFSDALATRQFGPISEVWRAQGSEMIENAGNTDKQVQFYHSREEIRRRVHGLLGHDGSGQLTIPQGGLVHLGQLTARHNQPGNDLFTHGHIFAVTELLTKVRAVLTGDTTGAGRFGARIEEAQHPTDEFWEYLRCIVEERSHRRDYLLSRVLDIGLSVVPPIKRALFRHLKHVNAHLHLSALAEAATIVSRQTNAPVRTAWIGHTHAPEIMQSGDVTLINTGTAGAEKTDEATFGEITDDGRVRLMRAWHPDDRTMVTEWQAPAH